MVAVVSAATPTIATPPTVAECDADRDAHLAALEANRVREVKSLEIQVRKASTDAQRASLREMIEHEWNREEKHRAGAFVVWRECAAYARKKK